MLALIVSSIGVPPETPRLFWDSSGWAALCKNPTGLQQLLRLTNFLRHVIAVPAAAAPPAAAAANASAAAPAPAAAAAAAAAPHWAVLEKLERFANRSGGADDYLSLAAFESDVQVVVGAALALRGGAGPSAEHVRAIREPVPYVIKYKV